MTHEITTRRSHAEQTANAAGYQDPRSDDGRLWALLPADSADLGADVLNVGPPEDDGFRYSSKRAE